MPCYKTVFCTREHSGSRVISANLPNCPQIQWPTWEGRTTCLGSIFSCLSAQPPKLATWGQPTAPMTQPAPRPGWGRRLTWPSTDRQGENCFFAFAFQILYTLSCAHLKGEIHRKRNSGKWNPCLAKPTQCKVTGRKHIG